MKEKQVVTCFLESQNKILILRRSEQVSSYPGKWAGISGYIETTADDQAITEIMEETSLTRNDFQMIKRGRPLFVEDPKVNTHWVVHPYLFHITNPAKIKIDWEHKEMKWIDPKQIDRFTTVPQLVEALTRVYRAY